MQCPFLHTVQGYGASRGWHVGALLRGYWPSRENPSCPAAGEGLVGRSLGEFQDHPHCIQLQARITFFSAPPSQMRGEWALESIWLWDTLKKWLWRDSCFQLFFTLWNSMLKKYYPETKIHYSHLPSSEVKNNSSGGLFFHLINHYLSDMGSSFAL